MTDPIEIFGIGNAIVDIIAATPHDMLARWDMRPGSMSLVDEARAHDLTAALAAFSPVQRSGGSVANSCVVASRLGARTAFLGTVADDELGRAFAADIEAAGVRFVGRTPVHATDAPTARCLSAVTPDGQRTMSTFLGAASRLEPDHVDAAAIAAAEIVYLEGYLFDPPSAQAAFRHAAAAARRVAISLSDPFCVDRHRDAFHDFIRDHASIVFANRDEVRSLYRTDDLAEAADRLAAACDLGVVTLGERGSLIVRGADRIGVAAEPANVVDTTGAGDAYAAAFLAGLVRSCPLERCGRMGSIAAAEIISHLGARPEADLAALIASKDG